MAKKTKGRLGQSLPVLEYVLPTMAADGIYERGIVDLDKEIHRIIPPEKLTPEFLAAVRRQIDDWSENLPAELDRIVWDAIGILCQNAKKPAAASASEADRVLRLLIELCSIKDEQRRRDVMRGYWLGRHVERMGVLPFESLVAAEKGRRKGAAKAGQRSAKLTPTQAERARTIYSEEYRGKVSKNAACTRTAAKLKNEFGVSVSPKTVENYVNGKVRKR